MSLINKMLQDLDKRHAADRSGKPVTQQLRPVAANKDWRRIMWEVIAGVVIGAGWAAWVMYQIAPRPIVTDLAYQAQARRLQAAAAAPAPAAPPAAQPGALLAPVPVVPAQAPAPVPAAAPAITADAPAAPGIRPAAAIKLDTLKFATEIATPLGEKSTGAQPRTQRSTSAEAPLAKAKTAVKPAAEARTQTGSASVSVRPRAHAPASIDKQPHVSTPAERAENEFRKATALLNQGRVAEAMDGFRSSLQQDGGHAAARQALVGLLLENRRIDEAQQLLQEGLALKPDGSAYAMLLARIQVERGDVQGAHNLLTRHAAGAANNADYHAFDAALLQRLGRHKEAVAGYQTALRLAPGAGVWWMGMGISLQAENRGTEALDAYRRARAAGGLSPDLLSFIDQRVKQLQ